MPSRQQSVLILCSLLVAVTAVQELGAAPPLRITELSFDRDVQTVNVTFTSVPGIEYAIDTSTDLIDWSEALASSINGGAGAPTSVDDLVLPIPASERRFIRVRQIPPYIEMMPVGDPGNDPDFTGFDDPVGAVDYSYRIGSFEVTNDQYAEFLNAVAAQDNNALYDTNMDTSAEGGITRSGESPTFSYAVKPDMGAKPVIYVSWYDALRFCNWLHNGRPTGAQSGDTTEGGSYTLTGVTSVAEGTDPIHGANGRNVGARFHLPSEDEWHKAAYHEPGASEDDYWDFATRSDEDPALDVPPGGTNSANYDTVVGALTDVGAYPDSASFYGTFDQGGNVLEWTEQTSEDIGVVRGLRGGAWFTDSGTLRSSYRDIGNPTRGGGGIGFRVASP